MVIGAGMDGVKNAAMSTLGSLKPKEEVSDTKKKLEITGPVVENPELAGGADAAMRAQVLGVNSTQVVKGVDQASTELTETALGVVEGAINGIGEDIANYDGSIEGGLDVTLSIAKKLRQSGAALYGLQQSNQAMKDLVNAMFDMPNYDETVA